jgi:hypothetical protein
MRVSTTTSSEAIPFETRLSISLSVLGACLAFVAVIAAFGLLRTVATGMSATQLATAIAATSAAVVFLRAGGMLSRSES